MNARPNKYLLVLIHSAVWMAFFAFPYVVGILQGRSVPPLNGGFITLPLQLMGLFYLNYLFLVNKYLFNNKVKTFILINLLLLVLLALFSFYFKKVPPDDMMRFRPPVERFDHPRPGVPFMGGFVLQALVVGLSVAIRMTSKWYEARQQVAELQQMSMRAELTHLKNQLNPHFLFNSLNNIYALIAFNPDKAQLSLLNLCDMLRYQLYESNREIIPLQKEMDFVQSYCDLMKLRLTENVSLEVDLPADCFEIVVPPLLFTTIVENAFKHGISHNAPSYISIHIRIQKGNVVCVIRNSYFPKNDTEKRGAGIGIENLRRRLDLLYPGKHVFNVERKGSEFVVFLSVKYDTLRNR